MNKLVHLFLLAIIVMPVAAFGTPVMAAQQSIVFQHMGLTYILMPSGIMCIGSNGIDTMSLGFTGGTNALKDGKVAKVNATCYAITFPLDGFTVYVRPLANVPLVKMLYEGKGYATGRLNVVVAATDEIERPVASVGEKDTTQAPAEQVKAGSLKFDWSDARDATKSWSDSAKALTFDVRGDFAIDPLLGESEGTYEVPHHAYASAFWDYASYTSGSGTIARDWEFTTSGTNVQTTGGFLNLSWSSSSPPALPADRDTGSATLMLNITENVHIHFRVEAAAWGSMYAFWGTCAVNVYNSSGALAYTYGCTGWRTGQYNYAADINLVTNVSKIELVTEGEAVGDGTWAAGYVKISNLTITDGTTDTVYYHAYSATNASYECTTSSEYGNAYLLIPKGTTVTGVTSSYTIVGGSGTSSSYSIADFNATHYVMKAPNYANCTAVTNAVFEWTAPNAVYDLDAPAYVSPGAEFPVTVTLKDPYGDPIAGQSVTGTFFVPEQVVTDPSGFIAGARALQGCTLNGYTQAYPSVSANTTAEYYTFEVPVNTTASQANLEFWVPDSYMGLSVELWNGTHYVNVDGDPRFGLSVPYDCNQPTTPAADWGTLPFTVPSGTHGTLKRVQLAMNHAEMEPSEVQLRATIYYATEPAVKFDGINDYIRFTTSFTVVPYLQINTLFATYPKEGNYYDYWDVFRNDENVIRLEENPSRSLIPLVRINNNNYDLALLNNALYEMSNVTIVCSVDTNSRASLLNGVVVGNRSGWADLGTINTVSIGASPTPAQYTSAKLAMFKIFSNDVVMLINATSFSGGENTIVVNYGTAGNGTAYGNVQYKVWTEEGFRATYLNATTISSASATSNASGIAAILLTSPSVGAYTLGVNTSGAWAGYLSKPFKVTDISLTMNYPSNRITAGSPIPVDGTAVYSVDSATFVGFVTFNSTAIPISMGAFSGTIPTASTGLYRSVISANDSGLVTTLTAPMTIEVIVDRPVLTPAFLASGAFAPAIVSEYDGTALSFTQTAQDGYYHYSGLSYGLDNFTWVVVSGEYTTKPFAITSTINATITITDVLELSRVIRFNVSAPTTVKVWLGAIAKPEQVKVDGAVVTAEYDQTTKVLTFTCSGTEVVMNIPPEGTGDGQWGGSGGGGWSGGGTVTPPPESLPNTPGVPQELIVGGIGFIAVIMIATMLAGETRNRHKPSKVWASQRKKGPKVKWKKKSEWD